MILVDKFNFEYLPICAFNSNAGLCWSYDIRAWVSLNLLRSPHMSIFLSNQKRFVFDPNMRDTLTGPQSDSLCAILFFRILGSSTKCLAGNDNQNYRKGRTWSLGAVFCETSSRHVLLWIENHKLWGSIVTNLQHSCSERSWYNFFGKIQMLNSKYFGGDKHPQ